MSRHRAPGYRRAVLSRILPVLLLGCGSIVACRAADREPEDFAASPSPLGATRVRLDFDHRPVAEVVAAIRVRSGLPVALAKPEDDEAPAPDLAPLTLRDADPVPFWEALERVLRGSDLQIETERRRNDPPEVKLVPLRGVRGPVSIDGVFRCEVFAIDHTRSLALGQAAAPNVPGRPVPTRRGDAGPDVGPTLESLQVQVQIRPEPRPDLRVISAGVPRVVAATDERGRSLLVAGGNLRGLGPFLSTEGIGTWVADLPLAMPDPPGTSLARLKAVVPLVVQVMSPNALDIPLAGAAGKSYNAPGVHLTVARIDAERTGPREETVVEVIFRAATALEVDRPPAGDGIEFRDARGEPVPSTRSSVPGLAGATRLTYLIPGPAPARLRYSGPVRTNVAVSFEFTNLPLP